MPRNGANVYSQPAGTTAVTATVIESAKYNSVIADIAADLNLARPVVAGGTGQTTVATAMAALAANGVNVGTDGTESAPAFSFTANPGTGTFRPASGQLGFTLNGTEVGRMVTNGIRFGATGNVMTVGTYNFQAEAQSTCGIALKRNSADTNPPALVFGKSRGTTVSSFTLVAASDFLADISAYGTDGTATVQAAKIGAVVEGTPAAGDVRAGWRFWTGTAAGVITEALRLDTNGAVTAMSTGGIGYGSGAGATVTQATSRTTGVTINTPTGRITMFSAAGSATAATFTVTNSAVSTSDVVTICQRTGTNLYNLLITAVANGSFNVTFFTTGGVATDAPTLSFAVIKGAIT